ncbi:alanine racemase [Leucobacter sp. CSA1]|uniref:Alanine racemase n=2 Tax=Leucobacter chromiisoli TaxID=2796471 RepID=A0A934Q888_9MICO|nr:alanine racemase [Leucobacter chromiisoli]
MTLDVAAVRRNERRLLDWVGEHGAQLFPHGKTTMAPALWASAIEAGARGITFATPWQARAGFEHGVQRVLLANNLVDPVAIRGLSRCLDESPDRRLTVWVDSERAVGILEEERLRAGARAPIDVLVDVGGPGGRTGARALDEVRAVAAAAAASSTLRLAGVAGWEGHFGADRAPATLERVRGYLRRVGEAASRVVRDGLVRDGVPIVSAGGSAYPDLVLEELSALVPEATVVLRSGAAQIHDDGLYSRVSPLRGGGRALTASMRVWARVLSVPEPELALLDAGKRDLAFDVDLPVPLGMAAGAAPGAEPGSSAAGVPALSVSALNDQHAFLRGAGVADLRPGDVVPLGMSHPCTAFDKWPIIATVEGADDPDPLITGAIATLF